jgi:predicted nucleotidyltransferase
VDILYDLLPGRRLGWEIEDLTDELSELFGRRVDLFSRTALHERLRATVLAEAQPLYAA